jgi:hypothetical protein
VFDVDGVGARPYFFPSLLELDMSDVFQRQSTQPDQQSLSALNGDDSALACPNQVVQVTEETNVPVANESVTSDKPISTTAPEEAKSAASAASSTGIMLPASEAIGPNGGRVSFNEEGDLVEWIRDNEDDEDPDEEWPMIIRRSERARKEAYNEFHDKVWWNRHQVTLDKIRTGEVVLTKGQQENLERGKQAARKIELKYGIDNLEFDDFEFGLICGRMSALRWVGGAEWEDSLCT